MNTVEELLERRLNTLSRRKFMAGATVAGAVGVMGLTGCGNSGSPAATTPPTTTTPTPVALTDADYLNFALNLEYLEAEYYLRATTGGGLSATDAGSSAGTVNGGSKITFTDPAIAQYANEIAAHELAHVKYLRSALGSAAVSRPNIDFTAAFNAAASAAGIGSSFNPFTGGDLNFLLGAFVFEDVGVTAYHGAAGLLTTGSNVVAAAGILNTEAYHAGLIRTLIAGMGSAAIATANQIATLRGTASTAGNASGGSGAAETNVAGNTIVAADTNSIAYDRTPSQVLHIVYLGATAGVVSKGGFYPNGMNGNIVASAS